MVHASLVCIRQTFSLVGTSTQKKHIMLVCTGVLKVDLRTVDRGHLLWWGCENFVVVFLSPANSAKGSNLSDINFYYTVTLFVHSELYAINN